MAKGVVILSNSGVVWNGDFSGNVKDLLTEHASDYDLKKYQVSIKGVIIANGSLEANQLSDNTVVTLSPDKVTGSSR